MSDHEDRGNGPETPEKKMSLGDILALARAADDDLLEHEIDLAALGRDLRGKVDNIVQYIDDCEGRAATLKKHAESFDKKAKAFENKAKRLREYVAECMQWDISERGVMDDKPKYSGNTFEICLRYSDKVEIKGGPNADPTPALYVKEAFKKYIRRSYEWDKNALKKGLKDNNELITEYAVLKKSPYIKINPKS